MGVVYKLKSEVLDFIINMKKDYPQLSCRKLVDVVWEKFHIKLSKSSINKILKTSHLSSPVGRRGAAKTKNRKFQIPTQKLSEACPEGILREPAAQQKPVSDRINTESKDSSIEALFKKKERVTAPPLEQKTEGLAKSSSIFPAAESKKIAGAGCFFLKATEWFFGSGSILGDLLKKHIFTLQDDQFKTLGDLLTYLDLFGFKHIEDVPVDQALALWELSACDSQEPRKYLEALQSGYDLKKMSLDLSIDVPSLLTEVSFVEVLLEDGASFYIDGDMSSVWTKNARPVFFRPLNNIIEIIAERIVNNVQSVVLCEAAPQKALSKEFYDFLLAFDNLQGKRIKRINFLDLNKENIVSLDVIPQIKRKFIAGIWPGLTEFQYFLESEKITKIDSFYSQELQKEIYFREINFGHDFGPVSGLQQPLRGIILRESLGEKPSFALLTNISEHTLSAQEVLTSYFSLWPNQEEGLHEKKLDVMRKCMEIDSLITGESWRLDWEEEINELLEKCYDIYDLGPKALAIIHNCCQRKFFPESLGKMSLSDMSQSIYRLNGEIKEKEGVTQVLIHFPEDFKYAELVRDGIKRFNEANIRTNKGKLLKLNIIF